METKFFSAVLLAGALTLQIQAQSPSTYIPSGSSEGSSQEWTSISNPALSNTYSPVSAGIKQFFPNPVTDLAHLRFSLPEAAYYTIALYDLDGKLVQTYRNNQFLNPGSYTEDLDFTSISSGAYLLYIFNGTERSALKVIKQ